MVEGEDRHQVDTLAGRLADSVRIELRARAVGPSARAAALRCGATARKLPARSPVAPFHGEIRVTRKPLIAGNWKMHGSLGESRALVDALRAGVTAGAPATMLLCPPYVYLPAVHGWLQGSPIALGAQDLADKPGRALIRARSRAQMLRDVGCSHVIVGHSERRALYGETDAVVATKFKAAQARRARADRVRRRNARAARSRADALGHRAAKSPPSWTRPGVQAFAKAVVAYEPVWAIGTGRTATPEQAQEVHAFIRGMIAARDATIAAGLSILYGGSVKGANARELVRHGGHRRRARRRRVTRRGGIPRDLPRRGLTKSDSRCCRRSYWLPMWASRC